MVEVARLESVYRFIAYRGFESPSLRQDLRKAPLVGAFSILLPPFLPTWLFSRLPSTPRRPLAKALAALVGPRQPPIFSPASRSTNSSCVDTFLAKLICLDPPRVQCATSHFSEKPMQSTSSQDIEHWLVDLQRLKDERSCNDPKFIKPYHLATLTHVLRQTNIASLHIPSKFSGYSDTMNLWGALGIPSPFPDKNRRPAGRYFPLQMLTKPDGVDDVANALVALFSTVCSNERTIDAMQTMLRELIGNCYAHTEVSDGVHGVICAQVWNGGRRAQIALADSGVGIRRSLEQNEKLVGRLLEENSCELATEYGVTSKPGRGHSGYGLAVARKLLEQNNGVLHVRSGYEAFHLDANSCKNIRTETRWDGTLLVIEWDLDEPVNISTVYAGFPLPEGMSDDEFDF